ncbi:SAV_2336 N-terminal domain-related protein [Streptomyces sp. NPDC127190]|uniref:SAV_2336 N-terminal domain-related protein n=1 Tax=unclassified Streptomyces TaxID=2593676 RepID=UPI003643FF2E
MSSEPAAPDGPDGPADPLIRLADVLAAASRGVRPTPRELAELLWLARHMSPDPAATPPTPPTAPERETPAPPHRPPPADAPAPPPHPAADPAPARTPRVPLHLPTRGPAAAAEHRRHTTLLAPAPPMLRHPLALQRALRPLGRRVDAPVGRELDERATADRIARLGAAPEWWLPVLRPARERWLRLNLVYDAGPTMPVWRPLIRELHTALAQSGAFRTVALYRAAADGTVRGPDPQPPADGRSATLLISDCMGPQWREGPAGTRWYATLHRWARRMPLAVVQPLPEHLWRDTALPTTAGRLSAPHPAAAPAQLTFTPYEQHESPLSRGAVPLPVLEPEPGWLGNWAALLAGPGGAEFPGAVAALDRPLPADSEDRTDVGLLSAEELVLRFRATASPEAFRLAGHLAVGRADLPVMRLVQAAVEPDPRPQHLAEVVLSGMLTAVTEGPPGSYAFRDGVRELLLLGLPRTARNSTTELLARVGEFIDRRAGRAPGEFRASVPSEEGTGTAVEGDPFATVSEESVRRLSQPAAGKLFAGRYRLLRETGASGVGWLAEDTREADTPVVVCVYPPDLRTDFTDLCARLRRVRHPGIARVRSYGFAGRTPYLVRDVTPGPTLHERLDGVPDELTAAEIGALLPPLADAVLALHAEDGPRGVLNPRSVALTPGGPVLTCLDSAPLVSGGRAKSLWALGNIVKALSRGSLAHETAELLAAADELLDDDPESQQSGARRLLRRPALATPPPKPPADGPEIHFTAGELKGRPEARITLEATVHEILARGSLGPRQYRVEVRPDGYLVRVEPGAFLLPVLVAVLRELPHSLDRLKNPPRLRVTFGAPPVQPPQAAADVLVVVEPALYDDFAASSAAQGSRRFWPLYRNNAPDAPPAAWYCPLGPPGSPRAPEPAEDDLVQGPFITDDLRRLGIPTPGRTAVVHTRPDGPLTLLDPIRPYGDRPPRPETYYWVDLSVHRDRHTVPLPSSGPGSFTASVQLSWYVVDPVAFVRGETTDVPGTLLAHARDSAARFTRRHPLRRVDAAEQQVNGALRGDWPVPGLKVSCTVRLTTEGKPLPEPVRPVPARRRLSGLLSAARAVLIGFDGPLVRLYTARTARENALYLLSLVAEDRDPRDALAGRPLPVADTAGRDGLTHPLDVVRAFAQDRLGPRLLNTLDELELRAVRDAPMTHLALPLVRALHRSGRPVSVATDVSSQAIHRALNIHQPPFAGIHGRRHDPGLLTPDPDCLRRALTALGAEAETAVLIGSSVCELTAAQQLGLRFIGYSPTATGRAQLREAGGDAAVSSLEPLLEAAGHL